MDKVNLKKHCVEAAQATAAEQVRKDDAGDLRLRRFFLGGSTGVPEFIE